MGTGHHSKLLNAITSLGDDSVIVSPEDYSKFEVLIGDYFNNGDSASEESGSEDMECSKF